MSEGKPKPKTLLDTGTQLAHERTDLAMDRNDLAGERTLMAWCRTSLAMIAFGFTIGKLRNILRKSECKGILGNTHTVRIKTSAYFLWGFLLVAFFLVALGTAASLVTAFKHDRRVPAINAMGPGQQFSVTFIEALLLAAVGRIALTSLVMQS